MARLPPGTVGVPYSRDLTVQGGTPPYRWMSVGALPRACPYRRKAAYRALSALPARTPSTCAQSTTQATRARCRRRCHHRPVISVTDACPLPQRILGDRVLPPHERRRRHATLHLVPARAVCRRASVCRLMEHCPASPRARAQSASAFWSPTATATPSREPVRFRSCGVVSG